MMDDDKLNTWKADDLVQGVSSGLLDHAGLESQEELMENHSNPAYDMTEVLQLQMFKEETLESSDLLQSLNNSLQESLNKVSIENSYSYVHLHDDHSMETIHHSPISINNITSFNDGKFIIRKMEEKAIPIECLITLQAPTAPGIRLDEETLTWLNQGQSYEIVLQAVHKSFFQKGTFIKSIVSIGFQERQHQYFEYEKYDEWVLNRPNDQMLELDVPMCLGVHNATHIGTYTNEIEFQWDPSLEARLYVKVNCLSSEFTKCKGESGVPLRLQIEVFPQPDSPVTKDSIFAGGCQVKVFRAKGANRKLKLGREKHESLSREEAGQLQQSQDITVFKKLNLNERLRRKSFDASSKNDLQLGGAGVSPIQLSQLKIVNNGVNLVGSAELTSNMNLSANSSVEETQSWLLYNRFHNYLECFANFTGADILRLSRSDLIQLCGPADGIRLNNCLQARASRPLLTMYVSPEWHQCDSGMREYHAMFLEQLTVEDLKRKLSKKCNIEEQNVIAILKECYQSEIRAQLMNPSKRGGHSSLNRCLNRCSINHIGFENLLFRQGPTGIHIHVDDDVVRNFIEEAHHVVEVLQDPITGLSRILLK